MMSLLDQVIEKCQLQKGATHLILNPQSFILICDQCGWLRPPDAEDAFEVKTFFGLPIIVCDQLKDEFLLGKIK